jgi:hypothetical protein
MLKLFESLNFSDSINITKPLPAYKKLLDGLDATSLLNEMNSFAIDANKSPSNEPWFSVYDINAQDSLSELANIGLTSGYQQWQMTEKQIPVPWQTWRDGIGSITKNTFESLIDGFHRPRYVTVKPGWEVTNHRDWGDNSKLGLRCHLILETNDDCLHYITDDEGIEHELHFAPGEVWFYNIEKLHRAKNAGSTVRKSISFELFNDDLF